MGKDQYSGVSWKQKAVIKNRKKEGVKKKYLTPSSFCYMISQVNNMNEILEQALLYDFYGELLTAHQKEIYEQFVLDDLSLGEIAADAGISRQGVHDIVKRCARSLEEYERKLHLVEKFLAVKEKVSCIDEILQEWEEEKENPEEIIERLRKLSATIIEEL